MYKLYNNLKIKLKKTFKSWKEGKWRVDMLSVVADPEFSF